MLKVKDADGNWIEIPYIKGEKGDTGDTGATGPAGPVGATGATGAKGDKGEKGDIGSELNFTALGYYYGIHTGSVETPVLTVSNYQNYRALYVVFDSSMYGRSTAHTTMIPNILYSGFGWVGEAKSDLADDTTYYAKFSAYFSNGSLYVDQLDLGSGWDYEGLSVNVYGIN